MGTLKGSIRWRQLEVPLNWTVAPYSSVGSDLQFGPTSTGPFSLMGWRSRREMGAFAHVVTCLLLGALLDNHELSSEGIS